MKYLKKRKRRRIGPLLVVLLVLAVTSVSGVSLAKYVSQKASSTVVIPHTFYFTSNLLRPEGATYIVYSDSATITLMNNDGKNFSSQQINYNITATDGSLTAMGTPLTNDSHEYTLSGTEGRSITVTAHAVSPYDKTLTATFQFQNPGEDSFYILDKTGYVYTLQVFTGSTPGDSIKINYDSDVVSDIGRDMPDGWNSAAQTLSVEPNSHYVLQFIDQRRPTDSSSSQAIFSGTITIGG